MRSNIPLFTKNLGQPRFNHGSQRFFSVIPSTAPFDIYEKTDGKFERGEEKYEGSMIFGVPHGKGKYVWPDKTYEGEWIGGTPWGKGKFTLKSGEISEGIFNSGQLEAGKVTHSSGVTVEGRFREHGVDYAKRTNIDGSTDEGILSVNEFVKTDKNGARWFFHLQSSPNKFVADWTVNDAEVWAIRLAKGFEFPIRTASVDGKKIMQMGQDEVKFFNEIGKLYSLPDVMSSLQKQGHEEITKLEDIRTNIKKGLENV
eukprot:TRINITY_DN4666_c0_g1_i1.p1 TRINITY_DN4666_c0_g1~~TRINITY_DN4666_c0_g1_i1.p1  ORF type:complete len:274 (+),score=76.79 TRINITY_DN4666_c0_g1_i1:54-824(+)